MVKSQLEQPKKLEHIATNKLAGWITLHAEKLINPVSEPGSCDAADKNEDSLSEQIKVIRNYFKCMPGILQNQLFSELLQQMSDLLHNFFPYIRWEDKKIPCLQRYIPARMLEVLFTKNITSLSLNYEVINRFGASLAAHSSELTALTDLKIDVNMLYYERDNFMENKIIEVLKDLRGLKYLSISSCTDNIIRCMAENCTLIERLDLQNYIFCTDIEIDILSQLPNMKNIYLYEPSYPLYREPAHEYINGKKRRVLERIALRKQFELKSYVNYGITLNELKPIFERHPRIEELTFVQTSDNHTLLSYLEAIHNLHFLRELFLYCYDFYADQIKEVLQVVGSKLHKIKLLCVENFDIDALKYVSLTCPLLQELVIDHDGVKVDTEDHDMFPCNIEVPPFRSLQKFSLNIKSSSLSREQPTENFDDEFMIYMLSNCPNIEYIDTCTYLSEDIMLKVLDKNPLLCLKKMVLYYRLSESIIKLIIENCKSAEVIIY